MNNMLLATTSWWNYVLIGLVVLLLIAMPILMNQRNKRETQKIQEQTNSLKVGDKVLTTSGVYGTIVELKFDDSQKVVVIETGGKTKSYLSIDAYAIYTVFKNEEPQVVTTTETTKVEETKEPKAKKSETKKTKKAETVEEQVKEVTSSDKK